MQVHEIPRNYKGEGRILFIFSRKALIYTVASAGVGLIFFFIMRMLGLTVVGIIITAIFALLGFAVGTFKIPETTAFEFTKRTGGETIDDVFVRWIKFKKTKNRIYLYKEEAKKEETKDAK